MFKKLSTLIFSLLIGMSLFAQTNRGILVQENYPSELSQLIVENKIDLTQLRKITNFLTHADITLYDSKILPKRKKAFIRNIKHLSEKLEWRIYNNQLVLKEDVEILYELLNFDASFKQAAGSNTPTKATWQEKIQLYKNSKKSLQLFSYLKNSEENQPTDLDIESPYWHAVKNQEKMQNQFDFLAKSKKINAEKNMVILFDELSYVGSAPKIKALDLDYDNEWSLKWGDEVHTDVLGSRIFAALGYDVDHPYYYGKDKLTLIFDKNATVKNAKQLVDSVEFIFKVDLTPFISTFGIVNTLMISKVKKLGPFLGFEYVRFKKCAIEGRPDRVKRIGSIVPNQLQNYNRKELRAALLVHAFIGNWDTREENTCLTTVHDGNYNYRMSGIFSDLGTSLGVHVNSFPADFKVGLVNQLPWTVFEIESNKITLKNSINAILKPYEIATYSDLKWMAKKISFITEDIMKDLIEEAGWPKPIAELYFNKMASRRASILEAFDLVDTNPIQFNQKLTIVEDGITLIKNGKLIVDYKREDNPESFLSTKGRTRNYGN